MWSMHWDDRNFARPSKENSGTLLVNNFLAGPYCILGFLAFVRWGLLLLKMFGT